MFCIQCGNRLPDDAIFCNACGNSTKPLNPSPQPTTGPTQSSRITTQFDNSGQVIPPSMNNGYSAPIAQFGAAQFNSNPNNPQVPPTHMPPMPSGSNPGNQQYPGIQTGPQQLNSSQQVPPTQMAPSQLSSNPNNMQVPPTQMAPGQYGSNPLLPPTQMTPMPSGSNPGNPQLFPTQRVPEQFSSNTHYPVYPPVQTGPQPYENNPFEQQAQSNPPGINSPYQSTQYSSDPLSQPWQVPLASAGTAAPPPPPAGLQQWLMRTVGPNLASNALFGVSLGGVVAAVIGGLAMVIIISIAHAIEPHVALNTNSFTGEDIVDFALGVFPLHNVFRDAMQLFLVVNGVGMHITNSSDTTSFTSPLNGFLIIPAILLTFGGYIAAGTDVKNQVQSGLLRGACIAIPYTILLFLMTTQANGCIPTGNSIICTTDTSTGAQMVMDTTTLLLFGVLWGVLFGILGASIKLARGQWRHTLYQYLRTNQRPQVVGAFVGSLVAIGIGSVLSFLVVACFIAYTSYSVPLLATSVNSSYFLGFGVSYGGVNGDWGSLTFMTIAQGLLYGLNVFFFSMNAPVGFTNMTPSNSTHVAVSLFGTTPQINPWFHVLIAIPIICLFLGGRTSAAFGRVRDAGAGALQGALIAIPFTVLVMLLTPLSTITTTYTSNSTGSTSQSVSVASAGVGAFDVFLWALLAGAVIGALGGMYQASTMNATGRQMLKPLVSLILSFSKPGYTLFARVSKQPNALQRTSTKDWLFSTAFCTFILLIGAVVVGVILISLNQSVTILQNLRLRDISSVVLIAIPGLLVLCTCAAALRHDPVGAVSGMPGGVSMPVLPQQGGPQMPQYSQYPQQLQQPPLPQYSQPQQPPYPQL